MSDQPERQHPGSRATGLHGVSHEGGRYGGAALTDNRGGMSVQAYGRHGPSEATSAQFPPTQHYPASLFARQTPSLVPQPNVEYPTEQTRSAAFMNLTALEGALPDGGFGLSGPQPSQRAARGQFGESDFNTQPTSAYQGQVLATSPPYQMGYGQQYSGAFGIQTGNPQSSTASHALSASNPSQTAPYFSSSGFMAPLGQQVSPYYYQGQYPTNSTQFSPTSYMSGYTTRDGLDGALGGRQQGGEFSHPPGSRTQADISRSAGAPAKGLASVPRGPPRKPKQSGHALWVGNLPPGAGVENLKDHFARDATNDILSVFLISKSNCAFVNYKTEASCAAAMARFHDSRFQGVRLVCRLRRTGGSASSGPAAVMSPKSPVDSQQVDGLPNTGAATSSAPATTTKPSELSNAKDKYFVVKSLTVEDLELSVRNGIWATQAHNEEALNKAYEESWHVAESVYLIFSANKSGEYFGYARMISPINDDPAAAILFAPKMQNMEESDHPRAIPTAATATAPKGRIIDDSARGTIFWEAELLEAELSGAVDGLEDDRQKSDNSDPEAEDGDGKIWGKPFKVEWLSNTRLPFYRTRGLRNPWNSNREVKIARDGTELETFVGRRLIAMFSSEPSPPAVNVPGNMQIPGMGMYGQGRPF